MAQKKVITQTKNLKVLTLKPIVVKQKQNKIAQTTAVKPKVYTFQRRPTAAEMRDFASRNKNKKLEKKVAKSHPIRRKLDTLVMKRKEKYNSRDYKISALFSKKQQQPAYSVKNKNLLMKKTKLILKKNHLAEPATEHASITAEFASNNAERLDHQKANNALLLKKLLKQLTSVIPSHKQALVKKRSRYNNFNSFYKTLPRPKLNKRLNLKRAHC